MIRMRMVGWLVGGALTTLGLVHCSAPPQPSSEPGNNTPKSAPTASHTADTSASTKITPQSTGVKTTSPTRTTTPTTPPPAKTTKPATTTTTTKTGPGPSCQSLTTCCGKLTNSLEQVGCLLAAGKANELVCAGAILTFQCSSIGTQTASHGPSCAGLTSGALYCGNDGPGGDPKTLYRCGDNGITIASQCANGCTINAGLDDACATAAAVRGGATAPVGASCDGLGGSYCGTDLVGGDANTLYVCDGMDAKPASENRCANGCVTMTDGTNDFCATAAPAPASDGDNPCVNLPDFSYCGDDGIGGNADTLYTCAGGKLTDTQICANGCNIGGSNVSDYCSFTTGATEGGASCAGLQDGFYCGTNGPFGDPDTLYTCSGGVIESAQACDFGCFAGDFGGSDSCN